MKIERIVLLSAFLSLFGCSTHSNFTALSSKNVNISGVKLDKSKSRGMATGKDCQHIVVLFPTSGVPTLDEALDRALEPTGSNIMLDASVDWSSFYIPYVYGETCWKVSGEVFDSYE